MTRILVVEDSPTQAQKLALVLESAGFDVELATDGEAALDRLRHPPRVDLIVSDIVMPRLTGYELCRAVKSNPQLRGLPVVLVTTLADPMDIIQGLECGADNFVPKPYDPELLIERIRTLLANRKSRTRAKLELGVEIFFLGKKFTITSDKEQILDLLISTFEDVVRTNRELQTSQAELARAQVRLEEYARRLEQRVDASEERYRLLFERASNGVLILDDAGVILEANHQAAQLFARTADDLVGRAIRELLATTGDAPALPGQPGDGKRAAQELEILRPDGEVRHVDLSVAVIDVAGRSVRLVILHDVTEQRKLRGQLVIADRMVSVGTMAAGIAHEINNPLASIMVNVDLAAESVAALVASQPDQPDLREVAEMLGDARDGVQRVREIVRDVKLFSRSEDDRVEPVDLRRVIESSLRMAWNEIRHRARLVKDYGDAPAVTANESRLGQVFLNLIVNAAQAIPEGNAGANEIRIRTRAGAPGWAIAEVSDTGVGMSAAIQRRLFSPFFTTKPAGVGTGLGLSICQRIVSALGGTITVDSAPGKGTTFQITLPAAGAAIAQAATTIEHAVAPSRRGRVLVIDDEPLIAAGIRRALSPDHAVDALTSATEALDHLRGGASYEVILCDLMMPQMTGMDLYEELERSFPDHATRMIFLTGGAFTPRARSFLDRIPNQRIEKPFDARHLRALINDRLK